MERQGARISGGGRVWQMTNVQGPIDLGQNERQFFRIETSKNETLLVYRPPGERGMRQLFLLEVLL